MTRFVAALLAAPTPLCSVGAAAQATTPQVSGEGVPELFSASYLAQVFGSLLLVFVCLFAVVFLLRRFNRVGGNGSSTLRVLGSASVGQREKIVLLDAGGEQLLIGVAPGSVRTLHVFPEPIVDVTSEQPPAADFAALLKAANPLSSRA